MGTDQQIALLDRILDPLARCLTPEAARRILSLRADAEQQRRMDELAERCNEGTLSAEERGEYEAYVSAANLIAVVQAKARHLLAHDAA